MIDQHAQEVALSVQGVLDSPTVGDVHDRAMDSNAGFYRIVLAPLPSVSNRLEARCPVTRDRSDGANGHEKSAEGDPARRDFAPNALGPQRCA